MNRSDMNQQQEQEPTALPSLEEVQFQFSVSEENQEQAHDADSINNQEATDEQQTSGTEGANNKEVPFPEEQGGFPFPEYGGYARPTEFAPGWQKRMAIGGTIMAGFIGGLLYVEYSNQKEATQNEPIPATATDTGEEFVRFPELFTSQDQLLNALDSGRLDKEVVEIENITSGLFSYEFTETVEYKANNGRGKQVARQRPLMSSYRGIRSGTDRSALLGELTKRGYSISPASQGQTVAGASGYSLASTILTGVIACAIVGGLIYSIRQRKKQQQQQKDAFSQFTKPNDGNSVEHPTDGFESLGGMGHIIEEMQEIKEDIIAVKSGNTRLNLPKGIILSGPPGTGKTALVRALAGETGIPVLRIDGSRLTNMLKGTGPASIARGFKEGRELREKETEAEKEKQKNPNAQGVVIVLIDEIDSVATSRNAGEGAMDNDDERKNIVNTMLQEMDGIDPLRNKNVIVVGTTNFGTTLDAALMRPGRFSVKKEIQLPASTEERLDILKKLHERIVQPSGVRITDPDGLEQLAAITQQKSGDELRAMLEDAVRLAERGERVEVTTEDLFESYQRLSFGRIRKNFLSSQEQELVAAHELGHGVMAIAGNIPLFLVSMMARGNTGGRVIIDPRAMGEVLQSQQALLSRVLVGVGGQAAERYVYGKQGITTGASGDLHQIRGLMRQMISVGMFEELYDQDISRQPDHMLKAQHSRVINELVSNAMTAADTILDAIGDESFRSLIDESVELDRELTGAEAQALFDRHITPEAQQQIQNIANSFIQEPLSSPEQPEPGS